MSQDRTPEPLSVAVAVGEALTLDVMAERLVRYLHDNVVDGTPIASVARDAVSHVLTGRYGGPSRRAALSAILARLDVSADVAALRTRIAELEGEIEQCRAANKGLASIAAMGLQVMSDTQIDRAVAARALPPKPDEASHG